MTTLRVLHLSDTHLYGDDSRHYGVVDTAGNLARVLDRFADEPFHLVVCSGDVSEDGTVESYERVVSIIEPWARERGARTLYAMGNHDNRATFRAVLGAGQEGDGIRVLAAEPGADEADSPVASAVTLDGWRTVVLDTSVPGAGYGELAPAQTDFLADVLATPTEHGTLVVMHHPPIAAQTELLQALSLDDDSAARLWDALRGTDVRAVLAGHYHHPIVETVHGIPVIVAPGVANLAEAFGPRDEESARNWAGATVVEAGETRVRILPVSEPITGGEVFAFTADQVQQIIAAAGRQ